MKTLNEQLKKALIDGEIFVTTKESVREAVKESIKHLGRPTGFYEEGEYLTNEQVEDISDEIIDYLTE